MSSPLARRSSHVAIALLCALVLLRMPLVAFAEEPTACPLSIQAPAVLTAAATQALHFTIPASTIWHPDHGLTDDVTNNAILIEYSILRL